MSHSFESVAAKYLAAKKLSSGTCKEYRGTVTKWTTWGKGVDVDQIGRVHLRDFLDWVHEKAATDGGSNAGRTANKSRENMRAILSWAWEQDFLDAGEGSIRRESHPGWRPRENCWKRHR